MLDERLVRIAAFQRLEELAASPRRRDRVRVLREGFAFGGERLRFIGPQGIFKPAEMRLPLSITTSPEKRGRARPYDDELGEDGFLRYRYRGSDPQHTDNRGCASAFGTVFHWCISTASDPASTKPSGRSTSTPMIPVRSPSPSRSMTPRCSRRICALPSSTKLATRTQPGWQCSGCTKRRSDRRSLLPIAPVARSVDCAMVSYSMLRTSFRTPIRTVNLSCRTV